MFDSFFLINIHTKWPHFLSYFAAVFCSIFSGIIIGLERERSNKPAGLRTFAFVSFGATLYALVSIMISEGRGDPGRVIAQIVTGVGFLGAGAVFKSQRSIHGLTTAAGIWTSAALGIIFGMGYIIFGICVSFLVLAIFYLQPIIERLFLGQCSQKKAVFYFEDFEDKKLHESLILEVLEDYAPKDFSYHFDCQNSLNKLTIEFCCSWRIYRSVYHKLIQFDFVKRIEN